MRTCRIAIMGCPFTPIHELGERISTYHNLEFVTLENEEVSEGYFADKIPSVHFDTGDMTAGSASQHLTRDPSDWARMRELDEIYVDSPPDKLSEEERESLELEDFVVVSSEIVDRYLAEWSDVVILLTTNEEHLVKWINKRRKCVCCGAVYHMDERPPTKRGYCDRCGSHIFQMERDLPENVRAQYRLWGREFWQVEKYLRERGNFVKVDIDKFETLDHIVPEVDRLLRKILKRPKEVDWNYSF